MHNQQFLSIEHLDQNEKKSSVIKSSAIVLLIIALILVIALIISIALVFTIGLKSTQRNITEESSRLTDPLYEPCACGCPSVEPVRIINGEPARPHSWPWQILLLIVDRNLTPSALCGGTLITNRHILTAAHCVHQQYPPYIFVFVGQHNLNLNIPLKSGYLVNKVYIHEGYNVFLHDDVAILTIEEPVRFDSYVRPICLASSKSPLLRDQEELMTIGWGRISGNPSTIVFPQTLRQVKLAYVPSSDPNCSNILQPTIGLHPGQMCAGKRGYNICQGDSGGPLMRRIRVPNTETYYWEQIGITSGTIDCGWNSPWPDIYTNIPYYYDWIIETIKRSS